MYISPLPIAAVSWFLQQRQTESLLNSSSALETHGEEWAGAGVQSQLAAAGSRGGLERGDGEEAFPDPAKHPHLCALRDQSPSGK